MHERLGRAIIAWAVVLVVSSGVANAQVVTFYEHLDYTGESIGATTSNSFVGWDWNDRITSVSVPSGATVTLYQHIDFGGASLTLTSDANDLRNYPGPGGDGTWNDEASSFTIEFGGGPPSPMSLTVLVNGSRVCEPTWVQSSDPEFQAIAATYGTTPVFSKWTDCDIFPGVLFPTYSGITNGAFELANFINAKPPGPVTVVSHSHGGNVTNMSTWIVNRRYHRIINLATPINHDLWYSRNLDSYPWGADYTCQASSFVDVIQFIGASPFQVQSFIYASYDAAVLYNVMIDAIQSGDWQYALAAGAYATVYAAEAVGWWFSTKLETHGNTIVFYGGQSHGDMVTSGMWSQIVADCGIP